MTHKAPEAHRQYQREWQRAAYHKNLAKWRKYARDYQRRRRALARQQTEETREQRARAAFPLFLMLLLLRVERNRERMRERMRAKRAGSDAVRQYMHEWRAKNHDHIREYRRRYKRPNNNDPEAARRYKREWAERRRRAQGIPPRAPADLEKRHAYNVAWMRRHRIKNLAKYLAVEDARNRDEAAALAYVRKCGLLPPLTDRSRAVSRAALAYLRQLGIMP